MAPEVPASDSDTVTVFVTLYAILVTVELIYTYTGKVLFEPVNDMLDPAFTDVYIILDPTLAPTASVWFIPNTNPNVISDLKGVTVSAPGIIYP